MKYITKYENLDYGNPKFLFTITDLKNYFDENPLHHIGWSTQFIKDHLMGKNIRLLSHGVYMKEPQKLSSIQSRNGIQYNLTFGKPIKKSSISVISTDTLIGVYDEITEEAQDIFRDIEKRKRERQFNL